MNTLKKIFMLILITISNDLLSQTMFEFDCSVSYSSGTNDSIDSPFGGRVKPNRTDLSGGQPAPADSYFPVLVVFIQFKNEPNDPRNTWPTNSAPTYTGNLIATQKNTVGNWWNWYDPQTEILSSHWAEVSRGKFHVIGPRPSGSGAFAVNLSKTGQEYFQLYNYNKFKTDSAIHREIWDSIKAQGLTDWRPYDRWRKDGNLFYFTPLGEGDGYVDMIYQVFKTRGGATVIDANNVSSTLFLDNAGYNLLGNHYFGIDTVDNYGTRIDYGTSHLGSGVTVSFRGQLAQYLGSLGHEHAHQMFSPNHSTYSRVSYGFGYESFYSPADMILNEYMTPTNVTFNSTNYLGDYSSRNSGTGNLLKVPVQGNEYFLLASRNKYSKWDRVMTGDTAQIDPYNDNSDYGKGLYIYHVPNGLNFPGSDISQQDMECADGLFEWEYAGQSAQQVIHDCFISGPTVWPYYKKKSVIYENDSSNLFRYAPPSGYTSRAVGDGISLRKYFGIVDGKYIYHIKWWGVGDQPSNSCNIGTDRLFTNDEEIYTRFDIGGDREDAWKPGYNEVFTPYSSPNTNTWTTTPSNQNSGIYIWYSSYTGSGPGDIAYIKVYKAGENGETDSTILSKTPPSRPMGLYVLPCNSSPTINSLKRIKLSWNHNMEPDMKRTVTGETDYFKRYKIYRSTAEDMSQVPPDALQYPETVYELIATVELNENSAPFFIDSGLVSTCNDVLCGATSCWEMYPVRYRVQAVDVYNDVSVLSDFVNTEAWDTGEGEGGYYGDNISVNEIEINEGIPTEYSLYQNYPNPFNPVTKIKYDIPFDGNVSIKIFDISGRLINTLVNEYKVAGQFETDFHGENLSSGVYYYKIESGEFSQVKKMILIK